MLFCESHEEVPGQRRSAVGCKLWQVRKSAARTLGRCAAASHCLCTAHASLVVVARSIGTRELYTGRYSAGSVQLLKTSSRTLATARAILATTEPDSGEGVDEQVCIVVCSDHVRSSPQQTDTHLCTPCTGQSSDDISISTIDVTALDPEEAVQKLVAQNSALTAHASRLRNIGDDNRQLRADNEALLGRTKQLEVELGRQKEVLSIAKAHHRCAHSCAHTRVTQICCACVRSAPLAFQGSVICSTRHCKRRLRLIRALLQRVFAQAAERA